MHLDEWKVEIETDLSDVPLAVMKGELMKEPLESCLSEWPRRLT